MKNHISIIISTYNQPQWLEKVLWGYEVQTFSNFELLIADDGSGEETTHLIESLRPQLSYTIKHIWQQDNGFQKSQILNKAIQQTEANYILMSDGDCIPRADFLQTHIDHREEGKFLSGGYFMLPQTTSQAIEKEDILNQNCFKLEWLKQHGLSPSIKNLKLIKNGLIRNVLNSLTPTQPTWNGHNASGWKKDIVNANGFDERMQYGGQDRELGERLVNAGIRGKQIRYKAICIHLDHPRGYAQKDSWEKNNNIRKHTRSAGVQQTPYGINKEIG